ncbi:uncharacterized protein [Diabrotica undecimpunctata]|uniref:uncharacterized protein n=1 Tax=Diabrotica undecimpunctata TaxID=50387 RepID=UPI003B63AFB7
MSSRGKKIIALVSADTENNEEKHENPQAATSTSLQNVEPSATLSQNIEPLVYPSTSAAVSVTSSEESDPFADSEQSYVPRDSGQEESDVEPSSQNSDEEVDAVTARSDNEIFMQNRGKESDTWSACEHIPVSFQFSGQSGVIVDTINLAKPCDIFRQFVTDEVLDVIVSETNRFAEQYLRSHVRD